MYLHLHHRSILGGGIIANMICVEAALVHSHLWRWTVCGLVVKLKMTIGDCVAHAYTMSRNCRCSTTTNVAPEHSWSGTSTSNRATWNSASTRAITGLIPDFYASHSLIISSSSLIESWCLARLRHEELCLTWTKHFRTECVDTVVIFLGWASTKLISWSSKPWDI